MGLLMLVEWLLVRSTAVGNAIESVSGATERVTHAAVAFADTSKRVADAFVTLTMATASITAALVRIGTDIVMLAGATEWMTIAVGKVTVPWIEL